MRAGSERLIIRAILVLGALSLAPISWANHSFPLQEKGDVVFRALSKDPFNQHSGIYMEYFGETAGNGTPASPSFHRVIEMDGTVLVRRISLAEFIADAFGGRYDGARTKGVVTREQRRAIIVEANLAADLRYVSNFFTKMVEWKDLNHNGCMERDEIDGLRSDAWVEYVYRRAGIQIQGDIVCNTAFYERRSVLLLGRTVLTPSDQFAAMSPAHGVAPDVTVRENRNSHDALAPGGTTADNTIAVWASDGPLGSDLTRFELWRGEPDFGTLVHLDNGNYAENLHVYEPPELADGQYSIRVLDQAGNDSIVKFQIATTPPALSLRNEYGQSMPHGSFSQSALVTSIATHNPAPLRSIELFTGNILIERILASPGTLDMAVKRAFASDSWHYVRACDEGLNCVYTLFGVFPPDTDPSGGGTRQPPAPPGPPPPCPGCKQRPNVQPLPPPDDPNNPPPPPWPPLPPGPPTPPVCRGEECLNEPPAPEPPFVMKPRRPKYCDSPVNCLIPVAFPHDPNAKYGPAGSVSPGQMMTYTIEFENEGEGLALETFVRDTLDPALDGATLVLRDMKRVNYLTEAETPTNFPWSYDPRTRVVTVMTGDAEFREGGASSWRLASNRVLPRGPSSPIRPWSTSRRCWR